MRDSLRQPAKEDGLTTEFFLSDRRADLSKRIKPAASEHSYIIGHHEETCFRTLVDCARMLGRARPLHGGVAGGRAAVRTAGRKQCGLLWRQHHRAKDLHEVYRGGGAHTLPGVACPLPP